MSIEKELVMKGIDTAITVLLADKVAAAEMRKKSAVFLAVHNGEITIDQAREQLRAPQGDELDRLLGNLGDRITDD